MENDTEVLDETSTAEGTVEENPGIDEIDDIEVLRERAKHLEAENVKKDKILERNKDKKEPEQKKETIVTPEYAKAEDIAIIVTNQARELVSDEIRENWDELIKIPLSGADVKDARSIASNMADRLILFKAKQTAKDTSAKDLSASSGAQGKGGKAPEKAKHAFPRPLDVDQMAEKLYS